MIPPLSLYHQIFKTKVFQYQQLADKRRLERNIAVTTFLSAHAYLLQSISIEKKNCITRSTGCQLAKMLNKLQVTSVQILITLIQKAPLAIQMDLITEVMFQKALQKAYLCDTLRTKLKKNNWLFEMGQFDQDKHFKTFFGIPLSVKDHIKIKETYSCAGASKNLYNLQQESSPYIKLFQMSGLIPFVKTNVSMLNRSYVYFTYQQSANFVWGRAQNPYNRSRSTGGSSGGEAGLLAIKGSILGFGGDIGGSLRIPAEFCGLYSIKSTSMRYPSNGTIEFHPVLQGNVNIIGVLGPMAKSTQDLAHFLNLTFNEPLYRDRIVPTPCYKKFNIGQYFQQKKLRIGYLKSISTMPSHQGSKRCINIVTKQLQRMGHEVFQIKGFDIYYREIFGLYINFMLAAGFDGILKTIDGERPIPEWDNLRMFSNNPIFTKLTIFFLKNITNQHRLVKVLQSCSKKSAAQYLQLSSKQLKFRKELSDFWMQHQIDLLITPTIGTSPFKHTTSKQLIYAAVYTMIWNFVDYPAGVIPVSKFIKSDLEYQVTDMIAKWNKKNLQGSEGLPLGVQIVGKPMQQQRILGVMRQLQKVLPKIQLTKIDLIKPKL